MLSHLIPRLSRDWQNQLSQMCPGVGVGIRQEKGAACPSAPLSACITSNCNNNILIFFFTIIYLKQRGMEVLRQIFHTFPQIKMSLSG